MIRSVSLVLAALAVTAVAAGAQEPQSVMVRNVVVSYGDLNLANPQDAGVLRGRIMSAAAQACGGHPAFSTHYREAPQFERNSFAQCRQDAVADALARVRSNLARN